MANPLKDVSNWLYHLGDVSAARAKEIANSNVDLVVIDAAMEGSNGPRRYTSAELDAMRGSNEKLIVSYISIGEAEDYRPYWQSSWKHNPPGFLSASNPEWPDNYKVEYWDKNWQNIIFKYVDDIVKAGFNGIYMDIVDGFQYWEEVAPRTGTDYRQEMASFVAAIRARAEKTLGEMGDEREFVLIGQNAEELIENETYLAAVDGVSKEDLRFYYFNERESGFKPVPSGWFEGSKPYLERAEAAGVEVFVVEYMTTARQAQYAPSLQAEIDYLKAKGMLLYIAEERDLVDMYEQPARLTSPEAPGDPDESVPFSGSSGAIRLFDAKGSDRSEGERSHDNVYLDEGHDFLYRDNGKASASGGAGNQTWIGGGFDGTLFWDAWDFSAGPVKLPVDVPTAYTTIEAVAGVAPCYGHSADLMDGAAEAVDAALLL